MKNTFRYIIISILMINLWSCEELFIGPQPKFLEDSEGEPALNVFGVLRPDSLNDQPASFVVVGVIASTIDDTTENWIVSDADVFVSGIDSASFYNIADSSEPSLYMNYNFNPIESNTYKIACYKTGYDTVYAYTKIPPKPEILNYSYSSGKIEIELDYNANIYLYDIYIFSENNYVYDRVMPNPDLKASSLQYNIETPVYMEIFGYDINLANYYGSVNVFIKPNTYREMFTAVENGYGCIGSMNKLRIKLN